MAQGDLMLGLIPSPSGFIGRTAHRKSARGAEDHIHTDRGHGVACRGTVHHKRVGCVVIDPKSLLTTRV